MTTMPTRDEAMTLLKEFNQTERAIRHGLAVEAAMRYMAAKRGGDVETWGLVGLVHDLDYEKFPEEHCRKTREILTERGWPEELIRAAVSHAWPECCPDEPHSDMEKTLYAVDELTGLVSAAALIRPSRSVLDMEARSVKKKWNEKRFASGVDRGVIERGAAMLGMDLTALIDDVIAAMRGSAGELGLAGGGQG